MSVATDSELRPDDDAVPTKSMRSPKGLPPSPLRMTQTANRSRQKTHSPQRWATLFGLAVVVALSVLVGWLGFRVHQSQKAEAQRSQFLQVARQGALNLTTIDWQHADADVHRILDGATGEFYDDFAKRSQPFIEVLKQAKATTVGTITEAGLESEAADSAQALVAVSVQTSNAGEAEQVPQAWRMRIDVQKSRRSGESFEGRVRAMRWPKSRRAGDRGYRLRDGNTC